MKKAAAFLLALALFLALCACGAASGPHGKYADPSTGATITFSGGKATFEDLGQVHRYEYEMDGETIVVKLGGGATVTAYTYDAETDTVLLNTNYGEKIPFEKVK